MDKKRNILIREMMDLIDQAKDIQTQIDVTFRAAYAALQKANMEIGIAFVQQIACTVPIENSIRIKTRSVMGTEIPLVEYDAQSTNTPTYAYYSTKMSLDQAKAEFENGGTALLSFQYTSPEGITKTYERPFEGIVPMTKRAMKRRGQRR